jgi:hypothetical protein
MADKSTPNASSNERRTALLNAYQAQLQALQANLELQLASLQETERLEAQSAMEAATLARLQAVDRITTNGIQSFIRQIRSLQETIQGLLSSQGEYESDTAFYAAFDKLIEDYEKIIKENIGQLGFINNRVKLISQQMDETNSTSIIEMIKAIFLGLKNMHSESGINYGNLFLGLLLVYISTDKIPEDYLFTPVASYIGWITTLSPDLLRGAILAGGVKSIINSIPGLDASVASGYAAISSTLSTENLHAIQQMVSDSIRNLTLQDMGVYIEQGDFTWEALDNLPHTPSVSAASSAAESVAESVAVSVSETQKLLENIGTLKDLVNQTGEEVLQTINRIKDSAIQLKTQALNQIRSVGRGIGMAAAAAAGTFVGNNLMEPDQISDDTNPSYHKQRYGRIYRPPSAPYKVQDESSQLSNISDVSIPSTHGYRIAERPPPSVYSSVSNISPFTQDLVPSEASNYSQSSINSELAGDQPMDSDFSEPNTPNTSYTPSDVQASKKSRTEKEVGGRKSRHHKKSKGSKKRKGQKGGRKTKKGKKHHNTLKRHKKRSHK